MNIVKILAEHKKWMNNEGGKRADLSGADLQGADLQGAALQGANLSRANLTGANLYGANLFGANLSRANLTGANLTGASLYEANLYEASLYGASLYDSNIREADLCGADLYGADLRGADLPDDFIICRLDIGGWAVRILPDSTRIGCQEQSNDFWLKARYTDKAIKEMHSNASAWWKTNGKMIKECIRNTMRRAR